MEDKKNRFDIENSLMELVTDPLDVIHRSGWFCIGQWALYYVGNQRFTKSVFQNSIQSAGFCKTAEVCSLKGYPIYERAEALFQLCAAILQEGYIGECAKFFYWDFLPCAMAEYSFLHSFPEEITAIAPVSCMLIHLCLSYADNGHGASEEIITTIVDSVFSEHENTMNYLGISIDTFERCWEAVHFLDATSPLTYKNAIRSVEKQYAKLKVKKTVLLYHYAQARYLLGWEKQFVERINPWETVQKHFDNPIPEQGISQDERLFNYGAYKISKEAPTDVIHSIFYKGRDDSKIESAIVRSDLKCQLTNAANFLIVNPSPAFLVVFAQTIESIKKEPSLKKEQKVTFAVIDKTVAFLYQQQFPQYRFVLIEDLKSLKAGYDSVILLPRDLDTQALWYALSLCTEGGYVTALVSQSVITNRNETFLSVLRANGIHVQRIVDVPTALSESKPRKKIIVSGRKSTAYQKDFLTLIFAETDTHARYLIPQKIRYSVPVGCLYKHMTMAQLRKQATEATETVPIPEPKNARIYDFSKEIKISYNFIYKAGELEKARAYYRNIHRPESETTRHKGKRPNSQVCERGLRGKNKEEILARMEQVAFYPEFCEDILADILDYYRHDLGSMTIKTLWFCVRKDLLSRISYNDHIAHEMFCGEERSLGNLISGKCQLDDMVNAMELVFGPNGLGKKQWNQLYLIYQVAVEKGWHNQNPLIPIMHVVQSESRKRIYMLNAATKKTHFTETEESRIVAYLLENIPASDKSHRMLPRCVVESKWLAGAFSLFAGLPIREICPLQWGDLHPIEGCEEMQILITKHLNSSGEVISNVDYGTKAHFRKLPLEPILGRILNWRKQYLMENLGYSEESLSELPIMLENEHRGRGRPRNPMLSRKSARKINKQLLGVAEIEEDLIALLDGNAKFDINLNAVSNDLFASNFRHKAYHTCGFTAGELCYYVGNVGPDTFSNHYCDYSNAFLQYGMSRKLYRWTYVHDPDNSSMAPTACNDTITDEQVYVAGTSCKGYAHAELSVRPSEDLCGRIRIEIECEHGFDGTVIRVLGGGDDDAD